MIWIGAPGRLQQVTSPASGYQVTPERQAQARVTLGGGRVMDCAPGVLRTWGWQRRHLDDASHAALLALYAGHAGSGPFAMVDGSGGNLLTVNQSGAGSADLSPSGITASGGMLTVAGWGGPRGPRQIAWELPPGGGTLTMDAPHISWRGIPAVPGALYRWQASVSGCLSTVRPVMEWQTWSGAAISASSGPDLVASPSMGTAAVEAAAPDDAVWLVPRLAAGPPSGGVTLGGGMLAGSGGIGTSDTALLIDSPLVSMPTVRDPGDVWSPGLGVPMIVFAKMQSSIPYLGRWDDGITIVEVR